MHQHHGVDESDASPFLYSKTLHGESDVSNLQFSIEDATPKMRRRFAAMRMGDAMIRFAENEERLTSFMSRRRALGLSVEDFAKSAGVTVDALNRSESALRGSGTYNAVVSKKVERALVVAEKLKADSASRE